MESLINIVSIVQILLSIFVSVHAQQDFRQTLITADSLIDSVFEQVDVHHVISFDRNSAPNEDKAVASSIREKFVTRYPTRILNFDEAVEENLDRKLNEIQPLLLNRTSILYVNALESSGLARERNDTFFAKLRALTNDSTESKFLFFASSEGAGKSFQSFLESGWANDLIDLTVCEIVESEPIAADPLLPIVGKSKDSLYTVKIHNYDPFTKSYNQKTYEPKDALFPNKMDDLHGSQLRVGLVYYPPYSDVAADAAGRVTLNGVHGRLLETIRDKLNFAMIPKIRKMSQYGTLLPNGSATGLIGDVGYGRLDAVAFGAFYFYTPFIRNMDRTTHISIEQSCAVVPLIPTPGILLGNAFEEAIGVIIGLIGLIWLSKLLLNFKTRNIWSPLNIGFLVLGIGVEGQPTRLRERFLYGCIMVVSLFYSSNVFAQLTSVNLAADQYLPFDSFEDLDRSRLVPILHPNLYNITFAQDGDQLVLQSLAKRAKSTPYYADVCPPLLLRDKNVTCFLEDLQAKLLIQKVGKDKIKLAQPCFWHATRGFMLRKASAYTAGFNRIIMRVDESGVQAKWWSDYFSVYARKANLSLSNDKGGDLVKMLKDTSYEGLWFFVPLGFSIATAVFAAEICVHRLGARLRERRRRAAEKLR